MWNTGATLTGFKEYCASPHVKPPITSQRGPEAPILLFWWISISLLLFWPPCFHPGLNAWKKVQWPEFACRFASHMTLDPCFICTAVCTYIYTQTLLSAIRAMFASLRIFPLWLKTVYLPSSTLIRLLAPERCLSKEDGGRSRSHEGEGERQG